MICICNEKYIFNKKKYYLPRNYSMNYKRYSIENNNIINNLIQDIINETFTIEIKENYFEYQEKELNEDYVSTGYFNLNYFLNLGDYIQKKNNYNSL